MDTAIVKMTIPDGVEFAMGPALRFIWGQWETAELGNDIMAKQGMDMTEVVKWAARSPWLHVEPEHWGFQSPAELVRYIERTAAIPARIVMSGDIILCRDDTVLYRAWDAADMDRYFMAVELGKIERGEGNVPDLTDDVAG
ncbi:hypothetical protein [Streptomyces luridiscabiei]|uniref:hypothetical protein n=1 Tax=Streptomyces luridiscabiei TaxID=164114 RepID=UPI0006E23B84|nr:hypothetical protein [Streptomyces luridiscabiei]